MKLSALYEATGYGMAYQIIGSAPKETQFGMFKPKTPDRWYYANSANSLRHIRKQECEIPAFDNQPDVFKT